MKSFRFIFVFLLSFFVLTSVADAQDRYRANGKRRMSSKSKGTLIGAGAGGTAGAIVGGGSTKGAIIGGAAGAIGGRALGKRADRKRAVRQQQAPVNRQNL